MADVNLTFRPLTRKRYRCNQTKALVKEHQLDTYRRGGSARANLKVATQPSRATHRPRRRL